MKLRRLRHKIICANVIDGLRTLKENSIQTVVTSPPYYGLRNYGNTPVIWGGRENCDHVWTCYLSGKRQRWGDTDTLSEKQASNLGSADNVSGGERHGGRICFHCDAWEGELGQEFIVGYYIRHLCLILTELRRVMRPDGLIFFNIGDGHAAALDRVSPHAEIKPKDLLGIPWSFAFAARDMGFWLRNAIVWNKTNGMPRSVKDCFTPTYEMVFMLAKSREYFFDVDAVKKPAKGVSLSRNQYGAKSSNTGYRDREEGKESLVDDTGMVRARDVWSIPKGINRTGGKHTAVFPEDLVTPCILAGSRIGDVILDPFAGSGTVAAVAKRLGRRSVSIDNNSSYCRLIRERVGK